MKFTDLLREIPSKFFNRLKIELGEIRKDARRSAMLAKEDYVAGLLKDPRYDDKLRLETFGNKIFSQFDEDGIVQEIFRRIGTTNKRFVEFGVGTGIENNTVALLLYGWKGLWIEGSEQSAAAIRTRFADVLAEGRLSLTRAFITAENINELIGVWHTGEIDLLSIDIDGNDYYVFDAIDVIKPRVVVLEYNAKFPPNLPMVQAYNAEHTWKQNDYYGMSLGAIERLARKKGYALVGCNLSGANAFLVREDLVGGKFHAPFTAENHYQPARYFLWQLYVAGQSYVPEWGCYMRAADDGTVEAISYDGKAS